MQLCKAQHRPTQLALVFQRGEVRNGMFQCDSSSSMVVHSHVQYTLTQLEECLFRWGKLEVSERHQCGSSLIEVANGDVGRRSPSSGLKLIQLVVNFVCCLNRCFKLL